MGVRQYAGSTHDHVVYVLDGLDAPGCNYYLHCSCGWSSSVASLSDAYADETASRHVETPYQCTACGTLTADRDRLCGSDKDRALQALSDDSAGVSGESGRRGDLTDDEAGAWADWLERVADDRMRGLG